MNKDIFLDLLANQSGMVDCFDGKVSLRYICSPIETDHLTFYIRYSTTAEC